MDDADYFRFYENELDRIGSNLKDFGIRDLIWALSCDGSSEAEEACSIFAKTLEWPVLSPTVRLEVCLRLACASHYCKDMMHKSNEEDDRTPDESITGLLIDYWKDVGRCDWAYERFCQYDYKSKPWYAPTTVAPEESE
jgi:hypothetical protein